MNKSCLSEHEYMAGGDKVLRMFGYKVQNQPVAIAEDYVQKEIDGYPGMPSAI